MQRFFSLFSGGCSQSAFCLKGHGGVSNHCRGRGRAVQEASFGGFVVVTGCTNYNGSAIHEGCYFTPSWAISWGSPPSSPSAPGSLALPFCKPWLLAITMVAKIAVWSPLLGKPASSRNSGLNLLLKGVAERTHAVSAAWQGSGSCPLASAQNLPLVSALRG